MALIVRCIGGNLGAKIRSQSGTEVAAWTLKPRCDVEGNYSLTAGYGVCRIARFWPVRESGRSHYKLGSPRFALRVLRPSARGTRRSLEDKDSRLEAGKRNLAGRTRRHETRERLNCDLPKEKIVHSHIA